ncbi:antibiotic biosynthesis monooxygenase [Saccharothrix xinjiangensis]|uniref:Antibiotic biosynthesis monooxygenase family protein n=1 Tax=Saccharothrix xinjiangensis TaxID=204798 RepID=A0ABV9XRJ5_9PSEU
MILEVAQLAVRPGLEADFEEAFAEARTVIARSPGFVSLELQRSVEHTSRYLLLVRWERLEDHTTGFRQGPLYPRWQALLHHFYDPFPSVEHYRAVP